MDNKLFKEIDDIEQNHWWFCGRRKIILNALKLFVRNKRNSAIDIGFGTGLNAELLREFSQQVFGIDPAFSAIELAKKRSPDMSVFRGEFPEYNFDRTYDIAFLLDVLEHIPDDAHAINRLEGILSKGGVALITVPALDLLWTEHDVVAHHKRRYTKKSLRKLILDNSGLKIEKISYFNSFLFLPILVYRFFRRILRLGEGRSDFFMLPKTLNAFLTMIFSLEAFLLKFINLPVGVSLICVVSKKDE